MKTNNKNRSHKFLNIKDFNVMEELENNKYFKIAKAGIIALGSIYLLGHVFGIITFTCEKVQMLKRSFKQ
jgi:hypothetical protein